MAGGVSIAFFIDLRSPGLCECAELGCPQVLLDGFCPLVGDGDYWSMNKTSEGALQLFCPEHMS